MRQLISQGAEARIYKHFIDNKEMIIKERFPKRYRHPILDAGLNVRRMKAELRCLMKCKQLGIKTPAVYFVDSVKNEIYMEFIDNSITVKQYITNCSMKENLTKTKEALEKVAEKIGKIVALMHKENITHGDLTTSNFLIDVNDNQISLIDFGLGSTLSNVEDKAVDLYVLERAILSYHPNSKEIIDNIMRSYSSNAYKTTSAVLKKLEDVRLRGRKRTMVG